MGVWSEAIAGKKIGKKLMVNFSHFEDKVKSPTPSHAVVTVLSIANLVQLAIQK